MKLTFDMLDIIEGGSSSLPSESDLQNVIAFLSRIETDERVRHPRGGNAIHKRN